jgi:hypothetical protein
MKNDIIQKQYLKNYDYDGDIKNKRNVKRQIDYELSKIMLKDGFIGNVDTTKLIHKKLKKF